MPTLIQQYSGYTPVLLPVTGYGTLFPPGSTYLYIGGPNPDVGPERSENMTLSATFQPSPRLQIVTSLFRIDYRDRVAPPFGSPLGILTNPLFTSLVTFNPSAAQRSEEHTSELQSLMRHSYAVFCLKKKNTLNIYQQLTTLLFNIY